MWTKPWYLGFKAEIYLSINYLSQNFKMEKPSTAEGLVEVKLLVEIMKPLVKGASKEQSDNFQQMFNKGPYLGMDNHFSVMTF